MTVFADGQCVRSTLHKQDGGTKSPVLAQHKILVEAGYLPGVLNVRADRESRVMDRHYWKLDPQVVFTKNQLWYPLLLQSL